jgi:hypothetical protein
LAEHELCEGHDTVTQNAAKIFITGVSLIEWLKTMFLPGIEKFRGKANCTNPLVFLFDGQSTQLTERLVTFAGPERIIIIRLVPHSFYLFQPLDCCRFGLFKILYLKEQKAQKLKEEV